MFNCCLSKVAKSYNDLQYFRKKMGDLICRFLCIQYRPGGEEASEKINSDFLIGQ